ncbi:MAG: NAD(P)H-hydrate dehydratase [Bacteroidetes bacterium]|nr:NAD(P)H-hydrate dehydratase [Bacteroidota bacterium]
MLKILTASEIRQADAWTIQNEPVKSIDLMERAARACVKWISGRFNNERHRFTVFCGTGNNGGDGLAIACLLAKRKYPVELFIIRQSNKCSDDFLINEKRLRKLKRVKAHDIRDATALQSLISPEKYRSNSEIIIDALFGTGLNKPATGLYADVIYHINSLKGKVISIDIPSGLFCENNGENNRKYIIKAHNTLTFQVPKFSLLFRENEEFTGEFSVLNIGLDEEFINRLPSKNYFLTGDYISRLIKPRKKFSHKGNYGHALLVAGSYGMMGAAVLASKGCLRSGVGLLTARIPRCGYAVLQSAVPESLAEPDQSENHISGDVRIENYSAIAIGPGLGKDNETAQALKMIIQNSARPVIFDADAINILSENKTWLSFIPKNSVFTPHPKEFERLAGKAGNDWERLQMQIDFSKKFNCYVVLKGAHTCITFPDGSTFFNSTGNPGMATGGSGDVLCGMILSFLAQGYTSAESCLLAVYLHGLAGDLAAKETGIEALVAGDIAEKIGHAFLFLEKNLA